MLVLPSVSVKLMSIFVLVLLVVQSHCAHDPLICINSCWNYRRNLHTCLECVENPPISDSFCVVTCGNHDRNFAFTRMCNACQSDPEMVKMICDIVCPSDKSSSLAMCNNCPQ